MVGRGLGEPGPFTKIKRHNRNELGQQRVDGALVSVQGEEHRGDGQHK